MKGLTEALPDAGAQTTMEQAERAERTVRLMELEWKLRALSEGAYPLERARLQLETARTLAGLDRGEEAWILGREATQVFLAERDWENAVDGFDVLYQCDLEEKSLSALGQGIWLAVTFPVDPALSIAMLDHVVDDTPDDSDGAAVAAATAVYIADLRTEDGPQGNLGFFARQMLGKVARRHGEVESQLQFDAWMMRMELIDPAQFLVRLRNVVDVLVQEDWWFDRDAVRDGLPEGA